jgi:hypothetical protein
VVARTSIRFARFAQAMPSSSSTPPRSTTSTGRTSRVTKSCRPSSRTPASWLASFGFAATMRVSIAASSACAAPGETPGRRRPMVVRKLVLRSDASGSSRSSAQYSARAEGKAKSRGITPTTRARCSPSSTTRPTTAGSPWKARRQSASESTIAGSAPRTPSASRSVRPTAARTPSMRNRFPLTCAPWTCWGSRSLTSAPLASV